MIQLLSYISCFYGIYNIAYNGIYVMCVMMVLIIWGCRYRGWRDGQWTAIGCSDVLHRIDWQARSTRYLDQNNMLGMYTCIVSCTYCLFLDSNICVKWINLKGKIFVFITCLSILRILEGNFTLKIKLYEVVYMPLNFCKFHELFWIWNFIREHCCYSWLQQQQFNKCTWICEILNANVAISWPFIQYHMYFTVWYMFLYIKPIKLQLFSWISLTTSLDASDSRHSSTWLCPSIGGRRICLLVWRH